MNIDTESAKGSSPPPMIYRRYNFFITAVRVLLITLLLVVVGCSSSRSSTPFRPPLVSSDQYSVESTDSTDVVRFKGSNVETAAYVTALESCGYPEKASLRGNVRQIFVGLEKLKIRKQEFVEIPPHRLYMVDADVESEGVPIQVTTYSFKEDDCVFDYVLWATPPQKVIEHDETAIKAFEADVGQLRTYFRLFINEALAS